MKKCLAFFLAAVLSAATAAVSVSAATTNTISNRLTDVPGGTMLYEQGILLRSRIFNVTDYADPGQPEKILGDGTDLIIRIGNSGNTSDYIRAGGQFKVSLENAVWDFAGSNRIFIPSGAAFAPGYPVTINSVSVDSNFDNNSPLFYRDGVLDTFGRRSANPLAPGDPGYDPAWTTSGYAANYDTSYGIFTNEWVPGGLPSYQVKRTYFRYGEMMPRGGTSGTGGIPIEIPYRLDITSSTEGYVTICDSNIYADNMGIYKNGWDAFGPVTGLTYEIRIPLVVKTVSGDKNSLATISGNTTNVQPSNSAVHSEGGEIKIY